MSGSGRPPAFFDPWRRHLGVLKIYWTAYGGAWAVISSPYLQVAIVLTGLFALLQGVDGAPALGIDVFSSLLGFTIGALAIVLAVSSTEVFVFLAEKGGPGSFFMKMVANFVHYTIIQVIGLVLCLLTNGLGHGSGVLAALFLFYAVTVSVSIGLQLFEMARVYNTHASLRKPKKDDP